MRRYFLTALMICSLGLSACYRDNWQVTQYSVTDKTIDISFMFKGTEYNLNSSAEYAYSELSIDCLNNIAIDSKLPDCMLPFVKNAASLDD
tara:strand:+ start:1013 stop:1285 length:273 start_codon:yes stop_codon:yes gene_type:complete